MARIRSIKPEFWDDDAIGALSLGARLLFIATWSAADDEGLLRWNAAYLKGEAFRYDGAVHASHVETWMAELVDAGLIYTYSTARDRNALGFIVNFRKHQRIDKPQASKMPVPNWRDPVVVELYARRDGWICACCREPLDDFGGFGSRSGNVPGMVAERAKTTSDDPTNIRVVHAACARNPQPAPPKSQPIDEFQERSTNVPGSFVEESTTDRDGIGMGLEQGVDGTRTKPPRTRATTEAPDDFEITQPLAEWASKYPFDKARLERETEKFLNHHRAKGTTFKDWNRAWQKWITTADEISQANGRSVPSQGRGSGSSYQNTQTVADYSQPL